MIITEQKSFSEIWENIKNNDNFIIIGCGLCATSTKTGGEKEVNDLKNKILEKGKKVLYTTVIDAVCDERKDRLFINKNKELIEKSENIIVMACGAGVQALRNLLDNKIKLHPALNTIFLGTEKRLGYFYQYCSMCGECILDLTNGICPITRCPKGFTNGPCGGSKNGKCEVNPDNECVWEIISRYQEIKKLSSIILPPKNYKKQLHPMKIENFKKV